jgi:two-component system, NarL family, sensor histidine kinase DegS
VAVFLPPEGLELARDVKQRLLRGEVISEAYEQRSVKKDGTEVFLRLSSSLIRDNGKPVAFQHIARDVTEEKRMHENLRFYLMQVTRAQEEERKRISRELHDDTIQALIVLSRQLDDLASNSKGLSEDNRVRLEGLRQQTNDIIQGVRRLSQDLRPAVLGRLGLLSSLEWLTADMAGYSKVATKINVRGTERRLPEEVELLLFRITQEALRNVWRHSEATQAEVMVEFVDNKTRITVRDNGKGFDLPKTIGDLARDGKLGLAGIQERAQLLGGTIKVQSQPGKGSSITVEVPA